jgi:hypothetical protein
MMNANAVKRWLKATFGLDVRANTTTTKTKWIMTRLIPEDNGPFAPLVYRQQFPAEFGAFCLRIVYGQGTTIAFPAGNVERHSVSMTVAQWTRAIQEWSGR